MSKKRQRSLALLGEVSLCLLLSGVAAAAPLPMKACDLVTAKDVESVLGSGFAPQDIVTNEVMSTCGYERKKVDVVGITLKREYLSAAQVLQMEQAGIKQAGVLVTPVSGLGEG